VFFAWQEKEMSKIGTKVVIAYILHGIFSVVFFLPPHGKKEKGLYFSKEKNS